MKDPGAPVAPAAPRPATGNSGSPAAGGGTGEARTGAVRVAASPAEGRRAEVVRPTGAGDRA
ncbi:MAG TPA: hypothetical protein VMQ10_06765, partial [Spirochaetia bacterium]|nr:hypothetical protein [Spirochaetia bacterium]